MRGFTQRPRVETFSPVVKPTTIRTDLTLALSCLAGSPARRQERLPPWNLNRDMYCSPLARFVDLAQPNLDCKLNRSLYSLKQVPRAWYSRFATFTVPLGFVKVKLVMSLFVYHSGPDKVYLLLYVNDIVLTAYSLELLQLTLFLATGVCDGPRSVAPLPSVTVEHRACGMVLHQ
jgi:hypothetical protein